MSQAHGASGPVHSLRVGGLRKGAGAPASLLSGRKLSPSSRPDAQQFSSSPSTQVPLELRGRGLSKSVCGSFKRGPWDSSSLRVPQPQSRWFLQPDAPGASLAGTGTLGPRPSSELLTSLGLPSSGAQGGGFGAHTGHSFRAFWTPTIPTPICLVLKGCCGLENSFTFKAGKRKGSVRRGRSGIVRGREDFA